MKKKLLALLLAGSMLATTGTFALTGCSKNGGNNKQDSPVNDTHQHKFIDYVSDENATCTEDGTKTATCKYEGCTETNTVIDADSKLGHNFIDYISDKNATCTEDGTKSAHCTHDGCSEIDTVTDTGSASHFYQSNYCQRCGYPFIFNLNINESSYSITGLLNRSATFIEVPKAFKGLSVTSIGKGAFSGCSGLTSITIPNNVTSIGNSAFSGCSGLTNITIPNSVTSIGDYAFYGCSGLTSITIGNRVTNIDDYAFSGCSGLTSITIGNSVTSIGDYAFQGCSGLTSITIPDSVTSIGSDAFTGCSGIIEISDGIKYVDKWVIESNPNIKSASLREDTCGIANKAFYGCNLLQRITIPDSVKSIGDFAFRYSTIENIAISNNVTNIGEGAFCNCQFLKSITVAEENKNYKSKGNCILSKDGKTLFASCYNSIIPSDLTRIGNYSLSFPYGGVSNYEIPDCVTSIGVGAFDSRNGLTSITIPNSVTSIGDYAFYGCSKLTYITFNGTTAQWKTIGKVDNFWNHSTGNYTVQCTDGKLDRDGNEIE